MRKIFGLGVVSVVVMMIVMSVGVTRPALADGPFLVGINNTTNVYDAPNLNADLIGQLTAGQSWFILGTDTTGMWIEVEITTSVNGWAPTSAFGASGLTLPVIAGVTGGSPTSTSVVLGATAAATAAVPTTAAPTAVATASPVVATTTTTSGTPVTVPYLVTVFGTTNAYDAPSTKADVIGVLTAGQTWFVLGADTTGKWAEVQVAGTATVFWVPASTLSLSGVVLPVIPGVTGS